MTESSGPATPAPVDIDALLPQDMALRCETAGAAKAARDVVSMKALAVLAGAFIAFGAVFMTVVLTGTGEMPFGMARLLGGVVFSLGLILVVIGGAELFTGDNLMVMAWAGGRICFGRLLRAWVIIYFGNLVGAVGTALLVFLSGHYRMADGAVGRTALAIAEGKAALPFHEVLLLGLLCNVLVCLAVWMSFSARSVAGKVIVIVPPVAAFVAAGFEHSVANMYLLPEGLLILHGAPEGFWTAIGLTPSDFPGLTAAGALRNLVASTIGNMVGGGLFVGLVYWFIYLRNRPA